MCGIVGELALLAPEAAANWPYLISLMARRGPDDQGLWSDGRHCTLGFRRLSILDLSSSGHQPMVTPDGRYAVVCNGEIYNFREIKRDLEARGLQFRSTGDTEVVLHALVHWGEAALGKFNGMFALAFYDAFEQRLLLARDHAGIKPLYYLHTSQGLVFASQYNQITAHPWSRNLAVNPHALGQYLRFGYIPAPLALLEQTYMLEPGSWLICSADRPIQTGTFFEFPRYTEPTLFGEEAYEAVNAALSEAVKRQLVSDVPVGVFLSGGIDSPLVAAKAREIMRSPMPAFTIGVRGSPMDESVDAERYARELGLDYTVRHFDQALVLDMLDEVVAAQTEPFGDYSIFPTLLVSKLARERVTVALSGDGGDELFWGYVGRLSKLISASPDFEAPAAFRTLRWGAKKVLGVGSGYWQLRMPSLGDWFQGAHSRLSDAELLPIFPGLKPNHTKSHLFDYTGHETEATAQWLRWNEYRGHLTRVLLKVDRASMYHSLEVRVPLLDLEVIRVAQKIDWNSCLDIERGVGKLPLRHALKQYTTHQTMAKRGFSVPMSDWLRGPLLALFKDRIADRRSLLGLEFDSSHALSLLNTHSIGQKDMGWGLWAVLGLILWNDAHFEASPNAS